MSDFSYPHYSPANGYLTEKIRRAYMATAIANKVLPDDAYRIQQIVSLSASNDVIKPIQFWQLYSALGQDRIVNIVGNFYHRVFEDEEWFRSVFAHVGGVNHHIRTQSGLCLDVMGGGPYYHGGEFRLSFHHKHNALQLMNEEGARRWSKLMVETLDTSADHMTADARVRPAINTFLAHFFNKYANEFKFNNLETFGDTNPAFKRKINFLNLTSEAIEALPESELREALAGHGVDVTKYDHKAELVNEALRL